ncbi:MAG: hypothetical protein E6I87_06045 [Chloroflexi bacterium]|nr:MAG: hypothetical protein E6I87_06045 [Chloroflexota bacterium]
MDDVEWLIERLGDARCASCGLRYTKGAVRGIGYENDYWFVYVTCLGCGTQGVGVAMTKGAPAVPAAVLPSPAAPLEPDFTTDDVLDAHELLSSYRGDVHGLFSSGAHVA